MTPLPATRVLEQFYLDARCRLLDLAAILDRMARGEDTGATASDSRTAKFQKALAVLLADSPNKAELIQQVFSLEYDPDWKRPKPRF